MTMLPMYKKCRKCGRRYSWNPDVGNIWCPKCGPTSMLGTGDIPMGESPITLLREILKNRKK
ncbi:MAG: hypothetical protein LUH14_08820 [Clostridiaceae bacterium]|nr:hypothetical protein [Clostridiaceae bacterium]